MCDIYANLDLGFRVTAWCSLRSKHEDTILTSLTQYRFLPNILSHLAFNLIFFRLQSKLCLCTRITYPTTSYRHGGLYIMLSRKKGHHFGNNADTVLHTRNIHLLKDTEISSKFLKNTTYTGGFSQPSLVAILLGYITVWVT